MTLKIERFRARVRLSGGLRAEQLDQVKTELQKCGESTVLDLEVRFLNGCEAKGVSVVRCSPFISPSGWLASGIERKDTQKNRNNGCLDGV